MIAIVGIDCRFPGATDPASFWGLLSRSGEGIGEIPEDRWNAREFYDENGRAGHSNSLHGGFLADADAFDNEFFAISPQEAEALDPQQRLLLECVWRAVEDSGVAPETLGSTSTGVFTGIMGNEWAQVHAGDYTGIVPQAGYGNGHSMAANRISYSMNFKGPSLAVDTACSSSLVAVHLACNALLAGECDHAIACGVNVMLTPGLSIYYTQAGLSAPDGRCKPFSAAADGIGRGEGAGAVMLRRLEDALADDQQIYAVIRGSAVRADGRSNGITAPSRWAQQEVMEAALRRADVDSGSVSFIEAHGTGAVLGDVIEAKALGYVYGAERAEGDLCAVGSVKGNIGHTEGAAGIAGLIKAALAMHHRMVPASRYAANENPELDLAGHGLRLLDSPLRLPDGPVRAGVSSFGLGGTNAHLVLESAPGQAARSRDDGSAAGESAPAGVFTITANSQEALLRNLTAQASALARHPQENAAPYCWTSNRVKTTQPYRFAVTARTMAELVPAVRAALADADQMDALSGRQGERTSVGFVFAGLGAQYPGMTADVYRESEAFRRHMNEADEVLRTAIGSSVRDMILDGDERVSEAGFAEPALFAVEYALARTLIELGVTPTVIVGCGVGEVGAACVAEVLSLPDAADLMAARSALLHAMPVAGRMRSVRNPTGELQAQVEAELNSAAMRSARERFVNVVSAVRVNAPRMPVVSGMEGRMLNGDAMDGSYWVRQAPGPVRFAEAVRAVAETGVTHLAEIGPRPMLVPGVSEIPLPHSLTCLYPCPHEESNGQDIAEVLATLFRDGLEPAWDLLYPRESRAHRRLAPYVFSDERRYWIRGPSGSVAEPDGPEPEGVASSVLHAVAQVGGYAAGEISPDSRLYEDLGFDSVKFMLLRDQLGEAVPHAADVSVQELLPHVGSVGELIEFMADQSRSYA